MTDEEMKGIAFQARNMIQTEHRAGKFTGMFIGIWHPSKSGGLHRMRAVEALIARECGPDWVGDKAAKAAVFGILADGTEAGMFHGLAPPEAYVLGGGCRMTWDGKTEASKEGFYVSVETRERVCYLTQPHGEEPHIEFYDADAVEGLLKIFR